MKTTVVGSYPIQPERSELASLYYCGEHDPYLDVIRDTVSDQVECGIRLVGDGQPRNNMINLFTDRLSGIRNHQRPVVVGEIEHISPITLEDTIRVKKQLPPGFQVKGIITGPTTLTRSLTDQYYNDEEDLIVSLARAMAEEARALSQEVPMIQVDEPFLSAGFEEVSREGLQIIKDAVDVPLAMHVCGDVSDVFDRLVDFPVEVLDHEFCAHPGLVKVIREHSFDQGLGFGCVRSDDDRVESVEEIKALLSAGIDLVGPDKLYADPDCGLRHRTRQSARGKLANMSRAVEELVKDG